MTIRTRFTLEITLIVAIVFLLCMGMSCLVYVGELTSNKVPLWGLEVGIFVVGIVLLFTLCRYLAQKFLSPLSEIEKEVERISKSLESQKMFVSNVSHEMRTPLAAIIAGLDLALQKERSKKEYQKTIGNALQDAHRMNRLIDGLLNLAKASYNKEEIKKQEIRLDELLLDARNTLLKAHPKYHIDILFETDTNDDDDYITVMGNLYLLNIAFSNLIENNCKYSQDKTSFIQISYWESKTIIRLSDSGIGMSDEDKEHLFTLFYRGNKEDIVEGHGIGMALSQRIIHLHDGNIAVYSEEGKGTTFVVELPHV